MKTIKLIPLARRLEKGHCVRQCQIHRSDNGKLVHKTDLWFEIDNFIDPPDDYDCDSYILATLMDAMKEGRDIVVEGSVSEILLSNLVEYQSAWNKWLPDTYRIVDIHVDSVRRRVTPTVTGAVCAFSGGVDATFSVWRHSQKKCSYRNQEIKLCAMVHGFDIPLKSPAAFDRARKQAKEVLDTQSVRMTTIRTNCKEILQTNWEHAFSCALISALSNLKMHAGTGIIGSSEPYNSLVIPWGSSPITDHLLSSSEFNVMHDGASHTRTEKIREIAVWTIAVKNLRVCWEGDLKDKNCGHCEKCIRTALNFRLCGIEHPQCFPKPVPDQWVRRITLTNSGQISEFRMILKEAEHSNQRNSTWVRALRKNLDQTCHGSLREHAFGVLRQRLAIRTRLRAIFCNGKKIKDT